MSKATLENSPILSLEGNILWQFENLSATSPTRLKEDVEQGRIHSEILLDMDAAPPRAPRITSQDDSPPVIQMQVAFLELLWSFIYSWMVLYEEGVQRPQLPNTSLPTGPAPVDLLERAHELLGWTRSLANAYTHWPNYLPSPINYKNATEQYFGEKANLIFQKATAFLLSHEKAHAVLGHLNYIQVGEVSDHNRIELEKDADSLAFDGLVEQGLDDNEKSAQAWAIISVLLSSYYVLKEIRNSTVATKHPALHHRVAHVVRALCFQGDGYRYYFPFLCRLVLQELFTAELATTEPFEDAEEALTDALDKLDAIGESLCSKEGA